MRHDLGESLKLFNLLSVRKLAGVRFFDPTPKGLESKSAAGWQHASAT